MHRLFELQTRQPPAMQLGPGRPPVMAAVAQQKARKLLARPAQCVHRVETGAHQIAHRLVPSVGNPHRRQLAGPVQPRQAGRIPPVRVDPVSGPLWDQRWRHYDAFVPACRQLTLNGIPARARLVAEPQSHPVTAKLARQPLQCRRRIGDPAVLADLAAQTALGCRHDDVRLVNIKPDIRDTIPHDPPPMHEARRRPTRCNPRYLHTVRRVAPYSGGHLV
jgi:hypothetical protein